MVNAEKIDQFCAAFLWWFLIGCLCLVGVALLLKSFAAVASVEPAPQEMIAKNRWFGLLLLLLAIAWFIGVGWLARFIYRRRHRHGARK